MTKIILFFGTILLVVNTAIGLLISNYLAFNWLSVNVILIINSLFLYKTATSQMSNGFKVSLPFIFSLLGFISIVLAVFSPNKFTDNYYLIGLILILLIEVVFYISANYLKTITSKK